VVREPAEEQLRAAKRTLRRLTGVDRFGVLDNTSLQLIRIEREAAMFRLLRLDAGSLSARYAFEPWTGIGAFPVSARSGRSKSVLVCTESFPHRRATRHLTGVVHGFRVHDFDASPALQSFLSNLNPASSLGFVVKRSVTACILGEDDSEGLATLPEISTAWSAVVAEVGP